MRTNTILYHFFNFFLLFVLLVNLDAHAMKGSKHDFINKPWATNSTCSVCHLGGVNKYILSPSNPHLVVTFEQMMKERPDLWQNLDDESKLCYLCHRKAHGQDFLKIDPNSVTNSNTKNRKILNGTITGTVTSNSNSTYEKCSSCHKIHNVKSEHLLRDDYGKSGESTTN